MLQAMYNGVSGIEAHQQRLDAIGNNIANVNTTAYKAQRVNFEDQLSLMLNSATKGNGTTVGGTNPLQLGLGVHVSSVDTILSQGALTSTGRPTDLAIQGNGYFMLGQPNGVSYTRDGSFSIDNSGTLVNTADGSDVLGWSADSTGKVNTTGQIDSSSKIAIPVGSLTSANATSTMQFSGNLSAEATPTTPAYTRSVNVYDSLGAVTDLTVGFTRNSNQISPAPSTAPTVTTSTTGGTIVPGTYQVGYTYTNASGETVQSPLQSITVPAGTNTNTIDITAPTLPAGATGLNMYVGTTTTNGTLAATSASNTGTVTSLPAPGAAAPPTAWPTGATSSWTWTPTGTGVTGGGTVYFDSTGKELSMTGNAQVATSNSSATPQTVTPDFSQLTQLSGASVAAPIGQNGFGAGTLQSFNIDTGGVITGIFSNGSTRVLGQLALAGFANPGGLERNGGNQYAATQNSGDPLVGGAGGTGLGTVSAGYLEQSNVDLSAEFTNLIITQRGFQAYTKIVSTVDAMLNDVISMKQG